MATLISLGQIIDKTMAHYKKHFVELISITVWILLAAIPTAIAKLLAPLVEGTEGSTTQLLIVGLNNLGGLLLGIVSAWALITVIIAVSEEAQGTPQDLKAQAKKGWKLFWSYIWVSILLGLVIAVILLPPIAGFILVLIDSLRGTSSRRYR